MFLVLKCFDFCTIHTIQNTQNHNYWQPAMLTTEDKVHTNLVTMVKSHSHSVTLKKTFILQIFLNCCDQAKHLRELKKVMALKKSQRTTLPSLQLVYKEKFKYSN